MRVAPLLAYIALSSIAFAAPPPKVTLLDLAKKKFASRKLTDAEEKLFTATENGEPASKLTYNDEEDDPENAATWSHDRVINADCLKWLCTNREASALVTSRGIRIYGALIDGDLDLSDTEIGFSLFAGMCAFNGNVLLKRTHIKGLYLVGCTVTTLNANEANISAAVLLRKGFKAKGEVVFLGATIGGTLDCSGAEFENPAGDAFSANRAKIAGHVYLRDGFKSKGKVDLVGAAIGGTLDCTGAQLTNASGIALHADSAKIEGTVFLGDGFKCEGEVNFAGAVIGGNLNCNGTQLINPQGYALTATAAKIHRSVLLRNSFKAAGKVTFFGGDVGSYFEWFDVVDSFGATLDLRSLKVGTLRDDERSWPPAGNLFLDGFTYGRINDDAPTDARRRINWLQRQGRDKFLPQPYEYLASVLRTMGHEREARKVMIAKNLDHARYLAEYGGGSRFFSHEWWWYNVFGKLIGYGYAPSRAFFISIGMIAIGYVFFKIGYVVPNQLILPKNENGYRKDELGEIILANDERTFSEEYPKFNAFVYSLESFTPLLRLDQSSNWVPNAKRGKCIRIWRLHFTTGSLLRLYLWIHIIAGWVFTSLWVGAVTGLVRS